MVGSAMIGFGKFVKDYPKLREGALAIANDIHSLTSKSFGFFKHAHAIHLKNETMLPQGQIETQAVVQTEKVKIALAAAKAEARTIALAKAKSAAIAEAEQRRANYESQASTRPIPRI